MYICSMTMYILYYTIFTHKYNVYYLDNYAV